MANGERDLGHGGYLRAVVRPAVVLALAAAAAAAASWWYITRVDPEVAFWTAALEEKEEWVNGIEDAERRVFFIGGSSCAFSIDPVQLRDEFGIESCNFGVHAGAGRAFQIELALQHLREGDVLVVAFETPVWAAGGDVTPEPLGSKLWYGAARGRWFERSRLPEAGFPDGYSLLQLRPGGYHAVTMAAKLALGRPLYRYHTGDIHPGGFMTTSYSEGELVPSGYSGSVTFGESFDLIVRRLQDHAHAVGAEVVLSLPWEFTAPEVAERRRYGNLAMVAGINEFTCPVLDDPRLGVATEPEFFADTVWHLSPQGAAARTAVVGEALVGFMGE